MEINFYHDLSEQYDVERVETLIRQGLGSHQDIQRVDVEVSAMRGGDPVFLSIEALDNWGEWRTWPGGYVHLSRYD